MSRPQATVHAARSEPGKGEIPAVRVEAPLTLTIFGASGDLTARKLLPGLFAMFVQGLLPKEFAILGCARRDWDDDFFRRRMRDAVAEHSRVPASGPDLDAFCSRIRYQRCDLGAPADYAGLRDRLADDSFPANRLFYLAIMPDLFAPVVAALKENGMVHAPYDASWTRVVIEKPFGTDLASARQLNRELLVHLDETQIYRIDHYLGKETVQNILSFRLANAIFDPLFNNRFVDHVQITAAETVGMEGGRGGYYDTAGAVRDMLQNHLLQLLCLVSMEPPSGLNADALHNEKAKVLQSVTPLTPESVMEQVVRAQYTAGKVNGKTVPGYREEERVAKDSTTDAYIALRLDIANWRWAGVPFFLRTGKRLPVRYTEIAVHFKMPPLQLFQTVECEGDVCDLSRAKPNVLIFRIQPDEGISLRFAAKRPAMQLVVEDVDMEFLYSDTWTTALPDAYERLLLDVMRGDSALFTRNDEVEAAWSVVEPILETWRTAEVPVHEYPAGTWGPQAADDLLGQDREWLAPEESNG